MTEYGADDFAFIRNRQKEIRAELEKGIQGTPEPAPSAKPNPDGTDERIYREMYEG